MTEQDKEQPQVVVAIVTLYVDEHECVDAGGGAFLF